MKVEHAIPDDCISRRLNQDGYVLFPRWRSERSTIDIGRSIGTVVDMELLLPDSGIPTVQTLRPRDMSESPRNQYSGTYGLQDFPLHTDLAHWARPPRYLMLRCISGMASVVTRLLPSSALVAAFGTSTLRRALVRPRRRSSLDRQCLFPLVFAEGDAWGFRWDSLFLIPMSASAQRVADFMAGAVLRRPELSTLYLASPADTLIVDNWQVLHGRGSVSPADLGRKIERVYLSEIHR